MDAMQTMVRTVLGDERAAEKSYEDGSVNCPFCWAAIRAHELPHCPNPACFANASWSPASLTSYREKHERAAAEKREAERQRAEIEAFHKAYAEERRAEEAASIEAVRAAGYCVRCFTKSYFRKKIRHRKVCAA